MTYGNTLCLAREEPILAEGTGDLVAAVEAALARAGGLDNSHIFVTARGSDVTLDGWVSSRDEVVHATEAVIRVKGVHAVHNEIHIRIPRPVHVDTHVSVFYERRFFPRFTGMAYHVGAGN